LNTPTPALVTQRAAQRLPRLALLIFCAAYVLPGLIGRDPWRTADMTAFGYMAAMAEGRTSWLHPTVGGLPLDTALLPHWLGAAFISVLSPWVDPTIAARLPFAILLALTLVLVWYSSFHLARTEAAQPVAFAFGGEAGAVDYARAMADATLLALIATLGLLQLGHETTPELVQLFAVALYLWSLAAAPFRHLRARLAVLLALPLLAASGAPAMAVGIGLLGLVVCMRSTYDRARDFAPWVVAATAATIAMALLLQTWGWRVGLEFSSAQAFQLSRLLLWFLWPAWLLALWTLWRWRHHLLHRHIAVPLVIAGSALVGCIAMGGSDRALMLGLPGLAVLAAFALPTMQRSVTAAIDWFSVFFFSACALAAWVFYGAMQLGVPAKPAANVAKLAPGFEAPFLFWELAVAAAGTVAWLWLVRWRTGRHRAALWKSLVLPAGGVALIWLLLMTLWLPLLDYARSPRPWVDRIALHVPRGECLSAPGFNRSSAAALEYFGRWRVDARAGEPPCDVLLVQAAQATGAAPARPGWAFVARARQPTDRDESTLIYRRAQPGR
jgi:4-amino-4-deoxy-L-arabinose transferase-like glycosyltransferase